MRAEKRPPEDSDMPRCLLKTPRFSVEEVHLRDASGQQLPRAVIRHPGAVTILPLLDDGTVCLIRNYRAAVGKTLIELPAGTLEPGELPAETAARELIEETGYRAQAMTPLGEFFLSPGILDERMHLFVATELTMEAPRREPGEQIENWIVGWDEAMDLIDSGSIEDAKTLVGLLRYDRAQVQQRRRAAQRDQG